MGGSAGSRHGHDTSHGSDDAWIATAAFVVTVIAAARAAVAFRLPLTGDEAYYWEWSRHLAFGYVDHPPMVAWLIASFAAFGTSPGAVRAGFVACGVVASLACGACAYDLSGGNRRAAAVAATVLAVMPLSSLAFASASPDGPYMMFWAIALWLGGRAFRTNRAGDWVFFGVALAGTVLSRVLGLALIFGTCAYASFPALHWAWRRGLPLALGTAFALCAPWLYWNATHAWITFAFALLYRHNEVHQLSFARLAEVLLAQAAAYSPGIFVAVLLLAVRPIDAFLAWTAIPQLLIVLLFGLFESVEVYWIFGAMVTFSVMLGLACVRLERRARAVWAACCAVPAMVLLGAILGIAAAPAPLYGVLHRATGLRLRNGGAFEIMTYGAVARDAAHLALAHDAIVMTDGYGFSSIMAFDAGTAPVVIGYDWQGREARRWYPDARRPVRALFVDKEPLRTRPDIALHLRRACAQVRDGGAHTYSYAGLPARTYYFTWCDGLARDGLAILRWQREPLANGS